METVLVAWVSLFPFVMLYGAYEGPKVFWFWIGGFFLTFFRITQLLRSKNFAISTAGTWFLLWITILFVSSLIGIHPLDSIAGGSYRHQGVLFFLTVFLMSETFRRFSVRSKNLLIQLLGAGVIVESIMVLFQGISMWGVRSSGTFGEPNAVAGYLGLGLYWIFRGGVTSRWQRVLASAIVLAAIVATQSRAGLMAAGIVTVGFGMISVMRHWKRLVFVTCVLGALMVGSVAGYVYIRVVSITRPQSHFENRTEFWSVGFGEFVKSPLVGYGAESEEIVYDRAYAARSFPLADFMIDRSHNLFLDVALWSGLIGLVVFIIWLSVVIHGCIVLHDIRRVAVVIAWVLFACVQPVGVVHWVQMGLLVAAI